MWKLVEIAEQKYFICCTNLVDTFQFILYDLTENIVFYENIEIPALLLRSKQLNKRIQYDVETLRETLLLGEAVQATFEPDTGDELGEVKTLKLKYRVRDCPLHFTWQIKRMDTVMLRDCIILPLLQTVTSLSEQINDLRELVRKKDVEIYQYKTEGAILRRTTVATQPFDVGQFDAKYKDTATKIQGYQNIAVYLQEHAGDIPVTASTSVKTEANDAEKMNAAQLKKSSPRNRKRKAMEFGQIHMERKVIQLKKQPHMQYESSQSQGEDFKTIIKAEFTATAAPDSTTTPTGMAKTAADSPPETSLKRSNVKTIHVSNAIVCKKSSRPRNNVLTYDSSSSADDEYDIERNERNLKRNALTGFRAKAKPPTTNATATAKTITVDRPEAVAVASATNTDNVSCQLADIQRELELLEERRLADLKHLSAERKKYL